MTDLATTPQQRPRRRGVIGPFSGRQLALTLVAVVVTAIVVVAVTTPLGSTGRPNPPNPNSSQFVVIASPTEGLTVGSKAPEFAGDGWQLTDLDGRPIRLAELRGKAVWIDFWASWCPPCQQETPVIREIAAEYEDRGLVVVGVQVQETVEEGRAYVERYGLEHVIGADVGGHVFRAYRVFGLPTQFFVDADGIIRAVVPKPLSVEEARAYVEAVLPPAAAG